MIDVKLDRSNEISLALLGAAEVVLVHGISLVKHDTGFIYLFLKGMAGIVYNGFSAEDIICQTLLDCFNLNPQGLEGRVLSLLGKMKVKNIEFWLSCEKLYQSLILPKEDTYKVIEGLTGLAAARRGTRELLEKM